MSSTSDQNRSLTATRRGVFMAALVLATVLASLDSSFVPIAFPDLIDDLDTSTGTVVWVALAYLIAATGPMLFLARVGDRIGQTALLRIGTVVYGLAMTACAFAPNIGTLIGLRGLQGLGMAFFLPATFTLAVAVYGQAERGKALGILASANAAGFILGPILAGWMLDSYDWRAIFSSRIPLAALIVVMAFVAVPTWITGRVAAEQRRDLDFKGAVLLSLGLFGSLFGLSRLPTEDNHLDPRVWAIFVLGLVILALFVRHERRTETPLIDFDLFRTHPDFAKASIAFFAIFASFPVYLFILPLVLISGLEYPAWDAGLLLAVVAVVTFLVSPWAGKLSDRWGAEVLCAIGSSGVLIGYLFLLTISVDASAREIVPPMVLFGLGTGLFFSPNNRLMMSSVPPEHAGMASGMIGTVRQSGYALGFAVTASLFTLIQDRLEMGWTSRGLQQLAPQEALSLETIFDSGGVWSPEVLIFILHVGAIFSCAVLALTLLYSLPRITFSSRRHLGALAGAAALAAVGCTFLVGSTDLWSLESGAHSVQKTAARSPVAPFGMASRLAHDVPAWAPPVLSSGREVFVFYCADCHGLDGRGVDQRGVDLTTSSFLQRLDDEQLTAYLRTGRQVGDPRNRTGRAMPGMETMPTFSDENYRQIIPFLRQLGS
ncbi:MAG: MFS transporter [Acidobacteriota bacterium]